VLVSSTNLWFPSKLLRILARYQQLPLSAEEAIHKTRVKTKFKLHFENQIVSRGTIYPHFIRYRTESERERREGCAGADGDVLVGDHLRARLAAAAQVKERKRARMITSASGPSSSVPPAGGVVAVEDTDALDCYLLLKPPIFPGSSHPTCSHLFMLASSAGRQTDRCII
jgi:hypothetical protein